MVKFEKLWLFERSEFQRFSNFIIAQCMAEIRTKPKNCKPFTVTKNLDIDHYINKFTMLSEKILVNFIM